MPAGPSQGLLDHPEVGPWRSTRHIDPPRLSRELQESEGEGYPALEEMILGPSGLSLGVSDSVSEFSHVQI